MTRSICTCFVSMMIVSPVLAADQTGGLPLSAARHVRFQTDEGTWLSLDLSRPAKSGTARPAIVFDLLGDLYLLDPDGGSARALTTGFAFDSQPRFSPDGATLAFVSDRSGHDGIWTIDADGHEARLVFEDEANVGYAAIASPTWTPDGTALVFWRSLDLDNDASPLANPELWRVDIATRHAEAIKTADGKVLTGMGPSFSPDGRSLYFAEAVQGAIATGDVELPLYQIARYDTRERTLQRVTNLREGAFRPIVSDDGRWLVYGSRYWAKTGLRIRDLGSGLERWLVFPIDRDASESGADLDLLPGMTFTPDSRTLLVNYGGKIQRLALGSGQASAVPFTADVDLPLGPLLRFPSRIDAGASVLMREMQRPRLSPDGKSLAFGAFGEIWVLERKTGTAHALTRGDPGVRYHPTWSADGRALIFCSWDAATGGHVWRLSLSAGAQPEMISSPDEADFWTSPLVLPSGQVLVSWLAQADRLRELTQNIWQGRSENFELRLLDQSAHGMSRHLAYTKGPVEPQQSAIPDTVFYFQGGARYYVDLESDAALIALDLLSGQQHPVLSVAGALEPSTSSRPPSSITVSPDARLAVVRRNTQSYLLPLSDLSAGPIKLSWDEVVGRARELGQRGLYSFSWSADSRELIAAAGPSLFLAAVPATPAGNGSTIALERVRPQVTMPRVHTAGKVLLRGARLITMRGDEVIDRGDVLIDGERIAAVGVTGSIPTTDTTRIIDCNGLTISPGFIDTHSHISEITTGIATLPDWELAASLAYGVTTLFDPDPVNSESCCRAWQLPFQELLGIGRLVGPRLLTTGQGLRWYEPIGTDSEMKAAVALRKDVYGYNWAKFYKPGPRVLRQKFAIEAARQHLQPTVEGAGVMRKDLTYIQDGFAGHEHTIPFPAIYRDVREFMVQAGTYLDPTLIVIRGEGAPSSRYHFLDTTDVAADEKFKYFTPPAEVRHAIGRRTWTFHPNEDAYREYASAAGSIIEAGGTVSVGGHGEVTAMQFHWELWSLASGMRTHDALRAATVLGAKALGVDQDLGSIEPGKLADLAVFNRNPLDDIRATTDLAYVIIGGRVLRGDTLDEVWPGSTPFGPRWWSDLDVPSVH